MSHVTIDQAVDRPRRVVARIADPSLPFGGTWTYELQPSGAGTALTITDFSSVFSLSRPTAFHTPPS